MLTAALQRIAAAFLERGIVMDKSKSPKGDGWWLVSGKHSLLYIDHRGLVSYPGELKAWVVAEYVGMLKRIRCDRIANVPEAATAITSSISDATDIPMLRLHKAAKDHGTGKRIDGEFKAGERVALIEDLGTTGGSILEYVYYLREIGLVVTDALVFTDREQGAAERLAAEGVTLSAAVTARDLLAFYGAEGLMPKAVIDEIVESIPEWKTLES